MRRPFAVLLMGLVSLAAAAATPARTAEEPYGIALEGFPYPFPVAFHTVTERGEELRMAYMDVAPTGSANGQTVLLLHGRNFPASYWEPTIRRLAAAGYRVIAPDQIGFGKSAKPDLAYSFDMMARHTASLLDRLQVQRVHVVGHSMGGMLAVRFTRTFPERVDRLALEAPIGLEDYRRTVPPVPFERVLEQERNLTADAYRKQLVTNYALTLPPEKIEPFVQVRERIKGSGEYPRWLVSFVAGYFVIWGQPVVYEIPLIERPTLFLMGEKDHNAPGRQFAPEAARAEMGKNLDNARALAAQMKDAKVWHAPVGHLVHLEAEEPFHTALLAFLAGKA
jgi:pimeloyl-ACP methyl ester carboxylesterase